MPLTMSVTAAEAAVLSTAAVIVTLLSGDYGELLDCYTTVTGSVHGSVIVTSHLAIGVGSNFVCLIGTVSVVTNEGSM